MQTNTVKLKNGVLKLFYFLDGRLVCGEYVGEKTYTPELLKGLKRAGISGGYINNCISMLQSGEMGELPLAEGYTEQDPGEVAFLFEKKISPEAFMKGVQSGVFEPIHLLQPVTKGQIIVKTVRPPRRVMKYPDGKAKILKESAAQVCSFRSAANTRFQRDNSTLVSEIDGSACYSLLGDVAVYPLFVIKSTGKAHGSIIYESALKVEADIRSESDVETISNLIVQGMIRSSQVKARGNIQCRLGFDNPRKLELATAQAGQSVFTRAVRNYNIWAGKYFISETVIENSTVQCLHTVATPQIKASEVRAGNKIYVHNVSDSSRIYLGSYFIDDTVNRDLYKKYAQHAKRMQDIEAEIAFIKEKLLSDKSASLIQLAKLKRISPKMIPGDIILNRYYSSLLNGIKNLKERIDLYKKQVDIVDRDRMRISFYEKQSRELMPVELIVTGTLSAGSLIVAANETLQIKEDLNRVRIQVEEQSGKLRVGKIDNHKKKPPTPTPVNTEKFS